MPAFGISTGADLATTLGAVERGIDRHRVREATKRQAAIDIEALRGAKLDREHAIAAEGRAQDLHPGKLDQQGATLEATETGTRKNELSIQLDEQTLADRVARERAEAAAAKSEADRLAAVTPDQIAAETAGFQRDAAQANADKKMVPLKAHAEQMKLLVERNASTQELKNQPEKFFTEADTLMRNFYAGIPTAYAQGPDVLIGQLEEAGVFKPGVIASVGKDADGSIVAYDQNGEIALEVDGDPGVYRQGPGMTLDQEREMALLREKIGFLGEKGKTSSGANADAPAGGVAGLPKPATISQIEAGRKIIRAEGAKWQRGYSKRVKEQVGAADARAMAQLAQDMALSDHRVALSPAETLLEEHGTFQPLIDQYRQVTGRNDFVSLQSVITSVKAQNAKRGRGATPFTVTGLLKKIRERTEQARQDGAQ